VKKPGVPAAIVVDEMASTSTKTKNIFFIGLSPQLQSGLVLHDLRHCQMHGHFSSSAAKNLVATSFRNESANCHPVPVGSIDLINSTHPEGESQLRQINF
jgi:hypothetical protein